jgi:hypothetical protein
MAHRNDVEIKTHYETKELCIKNLIDHKKKTFFCIILKANQWCDDRQRRL